MALRSSTVTEARDPFGVGVREGLSPGELGRHIVISNRSGETRVALGRVSQSLEAEVLRMQNDDEMQTDL